MTKISELSKVSHTIEVGGREWKLSPLTLNDMAELEVWLETRHVQKARKFIDAMGGHVDSAVKEKLILEAIERGKAVTFDSDEAVEFLQSIDGLSFMLYLSLRHEHKELMSEQVGDMIQVSDLAMLKEKLDRVSGLVREGEGKKAEAPEA